MREFTSVHDFLTNGRPGDTFTPAKAKRSLTTYRYVRPLTDREWATHGHPSRDDEAGALVEDLTTTHEGKAEYVSNRPEYAYWSYARTAPMLATEKIVTHVISLRSDEREWVNGTIDVTPAQRMSAKRLAEYHAKACEHLHAQYPLDAKVAA